MACRRAMGGEVEQSAMVSGVQRFKVDRDSSAGVAGGSLHSGAPLCACQLVSDLGGRAHDGRRRHRPIRGVHDALTVMGGRNNATRLASDAHAHADVRLGLAVLKLP